MKYSTKTDKKYRYEGHFVHGVRSGYGAWLWTCRNDSTSLKTAFRIFEESKEAGIAELSGGLLRRD